MKGVAAEAGVGLTMPGAAAASAGATGHAIRWKRVLGAAALGVALLLAAAVLYATTMPGSSHRGALPPLTEQQEALAARLRAHVQVLAVEIGERRLGLGDTLARARAYVVSAAREALPAGAPGPRLEPLTGIEGEAANVVVEVPGQRPGPRVLVGAHYDSAPGTPGANDNASGVAAGLELLRRLAARPEERPVRFVFFANEEPPFFQTQAMGSLQHAAGARARGEALAAMLSLETIGYYSDAPGSQEYPWPLSAFYPERGDFIGFVANLKSRALLTRTISVFRERAHFPSEGAALPQGVPGVGWSDHWAFWQHGYPAIMITDTAPFRYPHYHRRSDVPEHLDFARMARVVDGLEPVIRALASE